MSDLNNDPETTAAELGLEYVTPGPYDVFLDIDDADSWAHAQKMLEMLRQNNIGFTQQKVTISKSGNKHVYIRFDRAISDIERIALQACMGSDRKRELWGILHLWLGSKCPSTVFFEKPSELVDLSRFPSLPAPS